MVPDLDPIYEALLRLHKREGATTDAILREPALMRLGYVRARAELRAEGQGLTDSAVAYVCLQCIKEAADELPAPPPADKRRQLIQDDRSLAARIVLGVEPGCERQSKRVRRAVLKERLGKSETQVAHKRGGPHTFEEELLFDVATRMAELEALHSKLPDALLRESDFGCLALTAELAIHVTTGRISITRTFELRAKRDEARRFYYQEDTYNQRALMYEANVRILPHPPYFVRYTRLLTGDFNVGHSVELGEACDAGALLTLELTCRYMPVDGEIDPCLYERLSRSYVLPERLSLLVRGFAPAPLYASGPAGIWQPEHDGADSFVAEFPEVDPDGTYEMYFERLGLTKQVLLT